MTDLSPPTLDPAQLTRIEATHRGFLFQHLFAVRALLLAGGRLLSVVVETDEDVELQALGRRIYVQVKHRVDALGFGDIESALARFVKLRAVHALGEREGSAEFVIATNAAPNGPLATRMAAADWPTDVRVMWPGAAENTDPLLPPMPQDLAGAFDACTVLAGQIPLGLLQPETLVWKLAGEVMLAAAGGASRTDHAFRAEELPTLFEQLIIRLQDFPAPPPVYRPQQTEPPLLSDASVRLIAGYSGAGKTAWVAEAALHVPAVLAYFDVRETPGPALASGLARELAARAFDGPGELREVLLPGVAGPQLLEGLCRRLQHEGRPFTIVLDNVHLPPPADLAAVVRAAVGSRFILLAQPGPATNELAARLKVTAEALGGWSPDAIAAEAVAQGCYADHDTCLALQGITGGLPLYVQNALSLAAAEGGDVATFRQRLATQAHTVETAQELILAHAVDALTVPARMALAALSLADVPLHRDEAMQVLTAVGVADEAAALALRRIHHAGLSEVFGVDRLKVHDAVRLVGQARLLEFGAETAQRVRCALRDVLSISLAQRRDLRRFALYLRMLVETGDVKTLVQFATDELFHEMGVWPEIKAYLEKVAVSPNVDPEDRFWALDSLVFGDMRAGMGPTILAKVEEMQRLVQDHGLGVPERLAVGMKRMNALARAGDTHGVIEAITAVTDELQPSPAHQRIFRYNAAVALFHLGIRKEAANKAMELVFEYYELLGLSPQEVTGRNSDKLRELIPNIQESIDDIKHLADCLDLYAMATDAGSAAQGIARIHAMKFYELVHAPDSLIRVGQELVDDFVARQDFIGARIIFETNLLPILSALKLAGRTVPVRAQYAVVLSYCGEFAAAEAEMARLAPYEPGLSALGQNELREQRRLIATLKQKGPPPQRKMPPQFI